MNFLFPCSMVLVVVAMVAMMITRRARYFPIAVGFWITCQLAMLVAGGLAIHRVITL